MLSIGTLFGAVAGAVSRAEQGRLHSYLYSSHTLSQSIADRLGRKKAVIVDCAVIIVGTIIQISTQVRQIFSPFPPFRSFVDIPRLQNAWYQLMIGRIVTGLGVGALSAVIPLYQSVRSSFSSSRPFLISLPQEIAPKEIRGTLVALFQLQVTWGILVAYCISIGTVSLAQVSCLVFLLSPRRSHAHTIFLLPA